MLIDGETFYHVITSLIALVCYCFCWGLFFFCEEGVGIDGAGIWQEGGAGPEPRQNQTP